jgi:hypothetical protein
MKQRILTTAIMALLYGVAGSAIAEEHSSTVNQNGNGNIASVSQTNSTNLMTAIVDQTGDDNSADVVQDDSWFAEASITQGGNRQSTK